jgi:hypothetical protein
VKVLNTYFVIPTTPMLIIHSKRPG